MSALALEEDTTAPFSSVSDEASKNIDVEAARKKELGTETSESSFQPRPEPEPEHTPTTLPPVDGGIKAWSVMGGAFLALFVQFGLGNSYGTFQQYYSQHQLQNYSAQQVSWIGSVQLFLTFFLASIVGQVFDNYGARLLLIGGTILITLSLMLTSIFSQYHQLMICHGVVFGIGSAMLYNPGVSVAGQWFVRKRATASGIVASGAALGGVVFPIMFSRLVDKLGFGWTVRTIAFVCLVLLIITVFTLESRFPPNSRKGNRPHPLDPVHAFKDNAPYRWLVLSLFFGFWGLWSPFFFIGDYATYRGFSSDLAFYMLSIMNGMSMIGRLVLFIADKVGRINILIISLTVCGILELAMWTVISSRGSIFAFTILFGFFTGGIIGCFPACAAQVSPPERIGSRLGFILSAMSISTLTGPPIAGALLDRGTTSNMYFATACFSGAAMLVGAFFALLAKLSIDRRLLKVV